MEGKDRRSEDTGRMKTQSPGVGRRPYSPPSIRGFGRKLPAFAPPSEPQRGPTPWNS